MYSLHTSNSIYKYFSDSVSVVSDVAPRHVMLTLCQTCVSTHAITG